MAEQQAPTFVRFILPVEKDEEGIKVSDVHKIGDKVYFAGEVFVSEREAQELTKAGFKPEKVGSTGGKKVEKPGDDPGKPPLTEGQPPTPPDA